MRSCARVGVLLFGDVEVFARAAAQRLKLRVQMSDAPYVIEEFLLFGRAPLAREGVARVTREAAGEVFARGRLVRPGHADLVAVVKLRHAARRQDEGVCEFRSRDGRAALAHEAPVVVAADERD